VSAKYETFSINFLSGGNQRELARAKNLKKQQEQAKKKGGESGVALKERKERCEKFYQRIPRPNIRLTHKQHTKIALKTCSQMISETAI